MYCRRRTESAGSVKSGSAKIESTLIFPFSPVARTSFALNAKNTHYTIVIYLQRIINIKRTNADVWIYPPKMITVDMVDISHDSLRTHTHT